MMKAPVSIGFIPNRRRSALLAGVAAAAMVAAVASVPAMAQEAALSGLVIRGPVNGTPASTVPLTPSQRVTSPAGSWTEIAFADGTSIVLEPGAAFTLRGVTRDPATGRLVVRGWSERGGLRISTSDGTEVLLTTPGGEVRVVQASAVVEAGPGGGATLISGRQLTVRRGDGQEEVVRRPGFAVVFDDGGPRRQTRGQMAEAMDPFAPVERREARALTTPPTVEPVPVVAEVRPRRPVPAQEERRRFRERNEGMAAPSGTTQPAGSFTLAGTLLDGAGVDASGISAPRSNSGTSVLAAANSQVDPRSQEPDQNIAGIAAYHRFGTGRVRRFAAGASGAVVNQDSRIAAGMTRDDSGLVISAESHGEQRARPLGALFIPGATATLPQDQRVLIYDATAQVGVVDLNAFATVSDNRLNLVRVPRISVADAATPAASLLRNRRDPELPQYEVGDIRYQRNDVFYQFGGPSNGRVIDGRSLTEAAFALEIERYRAEREAAPNRAVILLPRSMPLQWSFVDVFSQPTAIGGRFLTDAEFTEAGNALAAALASGRSVQIRTDVNQLIYTGSAFFEVGLQNSEVGAQTLRHPDTPPTIIATTPTNGNVSRLFGQIGLLAYVGSRPLPSLAILGGQRVFNSETQQVERSGGTIITDGFSDDLNNPADLQAAPVVFIIDKITMSSQSVFVDRGIQEGERYFVIGGTPHDPVLTQGLPGSEPGLITRFAVSDGLNPINADQPGGFQSGQRIEAQFAGTNNPNQPFAFNRFNSFRPDETFVIRPADLITTPVGRGDTHLLVVTGNAVTPNVAMRGEVEVTADGRSSASVSVGGIGVHGNSLVLAGNTVGTARLATQRETLPDGTVREPGSLAIAAPLGSLGTDATGTEEHMFPSATDQSQIGYFAVGTQDVRRGAPGNDGGQPGTVEAVGSSTATPFTFTRLATNVSVVPGSPPPTGLPRTEEAASLRGFATGIVERVQGGQTTLHAVGPLAVTDSRAFGSVAIERPAGSNEFAAAITLSPRAAGELPINPIGAPAPNGAWETRILTFGRTDPNATPTTAWVSGDTFAAVRPGTRDGTQTRADGAAMISVNPELQRGMQAVQMPSSTEHLAWGMFLGDLVNEGSGGLREHVNMGFWVAGRPVDTGTLATLRGTASYQGGMIGTVAQDGSIRTAGGQFTQSWDFGARRGSMAATFDGTGYNIRAAMPAGSNVFTGSGLTGDRRMVVQGGFFNAGPLNGAPAAVGGAFGVAGANYGANGVFVGARR